MKMKKKASKVRTFPRSCLYLLLGSLAVDKDGGNIFC